MTDLNALSRANAARFAAAKLTRASEFKPVAIRLCGSKARYQAIEAKTSVPWWIVAVIHEREASGRFDRQLGQGDPLNRVSTHVPKGRGPFKTFEDGAVDALVRCAPFAAKWHDWTPGGALTLLEQYNGLGYAMKGVPSPYNWAGTDQYVKGKYVADGQYDPNAVDEQLGCAGLILAMQALDASIQFGQASNVVALATAKTPAQTVAPVVARPSIAHPAAGSVGAKLAQLWGSFFHKAA